MVKLTGPSISLDASGSIGDSLTFSTSKGRAYMKRKPTPAQPRTGNQISMRMMMQFLSQQWTNLSSADQGTWSDAYPDPELSRYNAYLKHNLARWRELKGPSKAFPATETGICGASPYFIPYGGVRHVKTKTRDHLGVDQRWGVMFSHSTSSTPTMQFDNMVRIVRTEDTSWHWWTHEPLPAGTHYYRLTGFTTTGKLQLSYTYAQSAVVT